MTSYSQAVRALQGEQMIKLVLNTNPEDEALSGALRRWLQRQGSTNPEWLPVALDHG